MIKIPEGFRELGEGEVIGRDDQWLLEDGTYDPVPLSWADELYHSGDEVVIRACNQSQVEFQTGAKRSDATGRGRFDLIPYEAMLALARRFEYGVPRFGERNWENGIPLSRILSSLRRHAMQINYDFTEDHVGAVLCNAAMFVTVAERVRAGLLPKELDDLGFIERDGK